MKSFKSIREGNSVEPGVSEIDDVPEDPMSFVEIKPKKTKVVKEGIVDSAANARVRIFSSIDRKKKELYKNAVKEDVQEAVTVKKANYSFGRMMTVHHGSDTSYPLHPENQQAIAKLGDGEKTSFKDETNSTVHAHREGDTVHLTRPRTSSTKTSVAHSHFNEEIEQGVVEDTLSELKKSTLGSYVKKAADSATMSAYGAGGESQRLAGEPVSKRPDTYGADRKVALKRLKGIGKATDRLTKEETEQMDEKVTFKDVKMAVGVAKDKRYAGGNMTGAVKTMEKIKPGLSKHPRAQQALRAANEGVDFLKIWNDIKPIHEAIKTTHEDPLVVTKDAEGHIHTHANLSVANAIHGTNVKHQAIHTGKPVQGGKFTFHLSKHHEGALKEDAPFDPVAHKKEHDRLMGKHIEAHKAVSKAFADMKAQGKSPSFDIPENKKLNDIKQEIAQHKAKVPRGPAPKPGSPEHYYASKKPGEYTGD